MRSPAGIKSEAMTIGQHAHERSLPDNELIQILCALVEELAANVQYQERRIEELERRKT